MNSTTISEIRRLIEFGECKWSSKEKQSQFNLYQWVSEMLGKGKYGDFGCELGLGLQTLHRKGRSEFGFDVDFRWLHINRNLFGGKNKLCQCDLHDSPIKSSSLNGICLINVLHLSEFPEKLLFECYRVLKKGGILIISIPYEKSIMLHEEKKLSRLDFFRQMQNIFPTVKPFKEEVINRTVIEKKCIENAEFEGLFTAACIK